MEWILTYGEPIAFVTTFLFGMLIFFIARKDKKDENNSNEANIKLAGLQLTSLLILGVSLLILAKYLLY